MARLGVNTGYCLGRPNRNFHKLPNELGRV